MEKLSLLFPQNCLAVPILFVGTNIDDDVQVQVQPIVGTIPVGTLTDGDVQVQVQPTVGSIQIGNLQLPVPDRW